MESTSGAGERDECIHAGGAEFGYENATEASEQKRREELVEKTQQKGCDVETTERFE